MVVGQVIECGNVFRGEHGTSIEGLRVQMRRFAGWMGPGLGWISPQRSRVAVNKER